MTAIQSLKWSAVAIAALALAACGDHSAGDVKAFDAVFVAAEADKGNFKPLKELARACHGEVQKYGRRRETCEALDRVGKLRKPVDISF